MTEMDVMRAMVRAKISGVHIYDSRGAAAIQGQCKKHDCVGLREDERFNIGWDKENGWKGCAKCILTCCAILEDPDMPTECEELALRAELNPARLLPPLTVAVPMLAVVSFALGALLL